MLAGARTAQTVQARFAPPSAARASVIVVNYNGGQALLCCIQSVLSSLEPGDELIVVDNASTDGSADQLAAAWPQLRLLRSPGNGGFAAGNNLGAIHAIGDYLVFLNPDTVVTHGWLKALLVPLQGDPAIGLTTAKVLLLDRPDTINTCGNAVHLSGLTLCRGMGELRTAYSRQEDVTAVSGAAFAMRRDLFERLGGFDDTFFMYLEDTDLSWRARLAGWRCVFVPDSVVYHDYRLRIGPRKVFYQERNRYRLLLKNYRWPTLLALLPALALAEVVTWGFVLVGDRAHLGNKLRAYADLLRCWPRLRLKHRQAQATRRVSDRELLREAEYRLGYAQTGHGLTARLAGALFDPAFWLLRELAMAVVWW